MLDLEVFFKEKSIPYTCWEIEHNGFLHIIDTDTVIQAILTAPEREQKTLASILFALDTLNLNIVAYLRSLAERFIANLSPFG